MTGHRRLRIAVCAIVGAILTAGTLTACGEPHPDISVTSVDFVSSTGAHFPAARRGASFVLPAGLPGEVRVTFTSEVTYGMCTLDFDGRAQLPVTSLPSNGDPQKPQMVSKRTGALLPSPKVPGTLTCAQQKAGSIPESSSFAAVIVLTPMVTASPPSLTFAAVAVGATSPALKVTLTSTGSAPATIRSLNYPGESFILEDNGCKKATLKVGSRCSFRVTFAPEKLDALQSGEVIVGLDGDALIAPDPIPLTAAVNRGEGLFRPSSDPLDFGDVPAGSSAERTLTLANPGTGPFYVKYVTLATAGEVFTQGAGAQWNRPIVTQLGFYAIAQDSCAGTTLAAGATCQVRLTFSPTTDTLLPIEDYLVFIADPTVTWDLLTILIPVSDLSSYPVKLTGEGVSVPQPQPTSDPQPQPHG